MSTVFLISLKHLSSLGVNLRETVVVTDTMESFTEFMAGLLEDSVIDSTEMASIPHIATLLESQALFDTIFGEVVVYQMIFLMSTI